MYLMYILMKNTNIKTKILMCLMYISMQNTNIFNIYFNIKY